MGSGTEQLKDSMSPCFTTPAEGSTDRLGGGTEGMERVGVAAGEAQRGRENNYVSIFMGLFLLQISLYVQ